jgi:hypothetical protein
MSSLRIAARSLIAALAFFASAAAFAHPKLVASKPADRAEVAAPATIELSFSESLLTKLSGADLTLTQMHGTTTTPVKIEAKTAPSADAKTLVLTPAQPLGPGSYRVDWHVVSTDTHAMKGSISFNVK